MARFTKLLRLALVATVLVAIGTATPVFASSFKTSWKEALKNPPPANSILGAWEGQWKSKAHGVSGPLRCVIKDLGNGHYEAIFRAQFHWFHFTYSTKLAAEHTVSGLRLMGEADLGWMGGLYKYTGEASSSKYTSTYRSPVENGVLELERPKSL
jgi:hypothetical protein